MSLSARDQQALDSIKDDIVRHHPELAALLVSFTRLASGEAMPARERIRVGAGRAPRCSCRKRRRRGGTVGRHTRRVLHRLGHPPAALLVSLLLVVALVAVTLALNLGDRQGACPDSWLAACRNSASTQLAARRA